MKKKIVLILLLLFCLNLCIYYSSFILSKSKQEAIIQECKYSDAHYIFEDTSLTLIAVDNDYCYYNSVEYKKGTLSSSDNSKECGYEDIISTKIVKIKDNKIICSFDLSCLKDKTKKWIHIERGKIYDGFLYFIADNSVSEDYDYFDHKKVKCLNSVNHPVYRIDTELKNIETVVSSSSYGKIMRSTLSFHNGKLVYLTDKNSVIEFDGEKETEIINLSKLSNKLNKGTSFTDDEGSTMPVVYFSPLNCEDNKILPVCENEFTVFVADRRIYCGIGHKLFIIKSKNIASKIHLLGLGGFFFLPVSVRDIDIYDNNLLKVTASYQYLDPLFNMTFIINPITQKKSLFYSKGRIRIPWDSDEISDYVFELLGIN